jgi:hypothetical protein
MPTPPVDPDLERIIEQCFGPNSALLDFLKEEGFPRGQQLVICQEAHRAKVRCPDLSAEQVVTALQRAGSSQSDLKFKSFSKLLASAPLELRRPQPALT